MLARIKLDPSGSFSERTLGYRSRLAVSIPLRPRGSVAPLLIGSSEPGANIRSMISIPIISSGDLKQGFVIPSTSIKGVFRKVSVAIAKHCISSGQSSCLIYSSHKLAPAIMESIRTHDEERCIHSTEEDTIRKLQNIIATHNLGEILDRISIEVVGRRLKEAEALEASELRRCHELAASLFCPVCNLYGSQLYASAIVFEPIILEEVERLSRTRIGIERHTKVVKEGALFTDYTILISGGAMLKFMVKDVEPGSPVARLLALTLDYMRHHGLQLGGGRSVGYGLLELDAGATSWYFIDYTSIGGSLGNYVKPTINTGLDKLIAFLLS